LKTNCHPAENSNETPDIKSCIQTASSQLVLFLKSSAQLENLKLCKLGKGMRRECSKTMSLVLMSIRFVFYRIMDLFMDVTQQCFHIVQVNKKISSVVQFIMLNLVNLRSFRRICCKLVKKCMYGTPNLQRSVGQRASVAPWYTFL